MSVEQDTREYHDKLAKFNRWYEKNYSDFFQRVKENYLVFEGFLSEYYPEWMEIDDLEAEHKKFLGTYYDGHPIKERWLEECHETTDKWLKEY